MGAAGQTWPSVPPIMMQLRICRPLRLVNQICRKYCNISTRSCNLSSRSTDRQNMSKYYNIFDILHQTPPDTKQPLATAALVQPPLQRINQRIAFGFDFVLNLEYLLALTPLRAF